MSERHDTVAAVNAQGEVYGICIYAPTLPATYEFIGQTLDEGGRLETMTVAEGHRRFAEYMTKQPDPAIAVLTIA